MKNETEEINRKETILNRLTNLYDEIAGGDEETKEFEFLCDELEYMEKVLKESEGDNK